MLIGKSAQENWELIDQAENDWWWFHLDKFPSAHVIVPWNPLTKNDLIKAALAAKESSKAAKGLKRTKVIFCQIKRVKKGTKVGEVITQGRVSSIFV